MNHTAPKPTFTPADFEKWFQSVRTEKPASQYVNSRLRARVNAYPQDLRRKIAQYLEWAHADARRIFHDDLSITLDPRGGRPPIEYPRSLPLTTRKGYFGEVLCGILAESGHVHDDAEWTVPIFLFRLHESCLMQEPDYQLNDTSALLDQYLSK